MNIIKRIFGRRAHGKRVFTAGQHNRLTSDWITSTINTNEDIKRFLPVLVERSRHLAKNHSDYRKWLTMRSQNIVGPDGFNFQAKVVNTDGNPDKVANEIIERHWKEWGKAANKYCTIDGVGSFRDFCELVDRTFAVDGEAFIHIQRGSSNPYGISLELIDSLLVDVTKNYVPDRPGKNQIIMGVEVDPNGKPLAYFIKTNPNDYGYSSETKRVPSDQIIHLMKREFAGQVRGFPMASAAILDMNMLQGYREAELIAARIAACQMGVWEDSGNKIGARINPDSKNSNGTLLVDFAPGKFVDAPSGKTLKTIQPTHPNADAGNFVRSMMRSIANGLSVFYNSFGNDLEGVNFSSMRSGALEERDNWKTCQRFFIENFLEKIYREWLRMFLLSGLSILPISKKDKFLNVVFQGRRWAWVDPYKDIQANALAIQSLIRSPQDVIRESGRDPEDVIAEISQFEQTVNKMGLTLFNIKKEVVNNADDEEENRS